MKNAPAFEAFDDVWRLLGEVHLEVTLEVPKSVKFDPAIAALGLLPRLQNPQRRFGFHFPDTVIQFPMILDPFFGGIEDMAIWASDPEHRNLFGMTDVGMGHVVVRG